MADKKGFDLASVLSGVSIPDTGREQIEYIDISNLISDGNNFYSLNGIEDLAANIETVGLQQPLRVRPSGAKYVIVSGHRRAAAIRLLVKDGGADLAAVPCIVERGDVSPAMRELRLIYANADTRKMSAADISRQAERVEALLYQLKEEGYDFPGRMRDHVAEACKVSKTKLARLKVIREKLRPDFLNVFEAGRLSETVAYAIAQESREHQDYLAKFRLRRTTVDKLNEFQVTSFFDKVRYLEGRKCPGTGAPCGFTITPLDNLAKAGGGYCTCTSVCCVNCYRLVECPDGCISAADAKAEKIRRRAEADAERERAAEERGLQRKALEQTWRRQWLRVGEAMERAGITPEELIDELEFEIDADELDALLDGTAEEVGGGLLETYDEIDAAIKMADFLHTSIDYLLGREGYEQPAGPAWRSGDPPADGLYWAMFEQSGFTFRQAASYRADTGKWSFAHGASIEALCLAWYPLPPDKEGSLAPDDT